MEEQSDGSKAVIEEELDKAQARTAEIDKYIQGLFEAKVRGEIDGSLFASLKKTYDEEKEQLNKLIIDLITKLSRENEANEKIQLLYAAIRKYDAVWELIEMPEGGIVTRLVKGRLEVSNGIVCGDTKADILPIFVVERFGRSGEIGSGFIKGLGIKRGAVAASFAQESNNVVVSGVDPADMLCAVKAVEANGGGAAMAIDGKVAGLYSLPVAGILSGENITGEIKAQKAFREALALTGGNIQRMTAVLTVSLCQTIPEVGLTEKGLFDVNQQRYIPTFTGGEEFEE